MREAHVDAEEDQQGGCAEGVAARAALVVARPEDLDHLATRVVKQRRDLIVLSFLAVQPHEPVGDAWVGVEKIAELEP